MTTARVSAALASAIVITGVVAADPVVRDRLGGGSFTDSGALILVADRADADLILDFITTLGGDWNPGELRYGDREFVRSTGTDALACAV
ncbi:hypothetical protein ACFV4K_30450 [Nocardia sp. NPDC059764]|uniref:hypothetical protein n=1 Tax=Nocardia sp. NPDC059764 TaxID=3346939 RepID=UPI00365B7AA2